MNHQASPSSSTHSLSQSHPQPHALPQLHFGYSVLQQPTHHHHQHYNHAPSQSHSQSYSQLPTFHGSMVSAPLSNLELIPMPSHRLEESISSSYMRSGRTLKLAEDETSTLHHHPAGVVNEYTPRGPTSTAYTSQHDTHPSSHQYEVRCSPSTQPDDPDKTFIDGLSVDPAFVFFEFGACLCSFSTVVVTRNYRPQWRPVSKHYVSDDVVE